MIDVFYTTRSGQVTCDKTGLREIADEDFKDTLRRAEKKVAKLGGTISHLGR